tara:strand:- start:379 stop:633 length:255 start_codon:yes stop_codon:yes gene_type:complete
MDELLDMITKDESPSGISDAIKDALYAKSAEKIGAHKNAVASSLFGSPEDEEQLQQDVEDAAARISGQDQNGEAEVESEPEGEE